LGVSGKAGWCFFKGKILTAAVEKNEIVQFVLARRNDCAYRRHNIHYDKTFIDILAPCLRQKPYLNFALKKILSSLTGLWIAVIIRVRNLSNMNKNDSIVTRFYSIS
jgi:hypothetical protein